MKLVRAAGLALLTSFALTTAAAAATVAFSGNGGNGTGALVASGTFDLAFKMTSNNNRSPNIQSAWGGTSGDQALLISGIWRYGTADRRGSGKDPLGFYVGTVFTALSEILPASEDQRGRFSFLVPQNTSFSWVLASTDGRKGRAKARVRANVVAMTAPPIAAVPLPAGGLLLLGAMAGLAALRRRNPAA